MTDNTHEEMHKISGEIKEYGKLVLVIISVLLIMQIFNIPCPILWLTGISCAGCGMTRAWAALLQGEVVKSFQYHPMVLLPLIAGVCSFIKPYINSKLYKIGNILFIFLFMGTYLYRLAKPGDIVVCKIEKGFIYIMIKNLSKYAM